MQQTLIAVAGRRDAVLFAPLVESTSWRAGFVVAAAVPLVAVVVLRPLRA